MVAYYNEIDPKAAAWLRELIKQGHIAPGDVDERDIRDINPTELAGYAQCHFFAGIGGWSLALRLAGWPDDRPVWTGSCPCQPFSAAGRRAGVADERHLWPHWHHLISQCQPATVFGEQVASKDGLGWLDLVSADMEATGYAVAAEDICAAGLGAPHIRQRLWFVGLGDAANSGHIGRNLADEAGPQRAAFAREPVIIADKGRGRDDAADDGASNGLADASGERHNGQQVCLQSREPRQEGAEAAGGGRSGGLANADNSRPQGHGRLGRINVPPEREAAERHRPEGCMDVRPSPTNGFWRDADWLFCRDKKWRPVEPGTFPLAHGLPARMGRLRGYGNAIVPQVAAAWIGAVMEHTNGR